MKKRTSKRRKTVRRPTLSGSEVAFTIDAIDAADQVLDLLNRASADEGELHYDELITFIQDHALVPARVRLCQVLGTAVTPVPRRRS